ncbi:MAG: trehalose 6-phosphate phosphatase [Thermoleophilaceae bacterium]|nr:trehalose 6-phosphate phosphatase [Thermoleophilaceae bacterium]
MESAKGVAPDRADWQCRPMRPADPPPPLRLVEHPALFLDFDGTLVALAARPAEIIVAPQLPDLLDQLSLRLEGRLAIVTGRALADLDSHLRLPHIAASGSHGLERRGAATEPPPGLGDAHAAFARAAAAARGLIVETKPASVALHYRLAPEREAEVCALAESLAGRTGLQVQHGKLVVELRAPGADKGDAVTAMMAEPPFAGARPVFVGDDLTDEAGFRAAAAMGGFGVLVGDARDSAAAYRLPDVGAVHAWLAAEAGHG